MVSISADEAQEQRVKGQEKKADNKRNTGFN